MITFPKLSIISTCKLIPSQINTIKLYILRKLKALEQLMFLMLQ